MAIFEWVFMPVSRSLALCILSINLIKIEKIESFKKIITVVNLIYSVPGVRIPAPVSSRCGCIKYIDYFC
jgi:hypothetical protein